MKTFEVSDFKFFGESAYYSSGNEEEKQKAKQYLELWKEFLLRKLKEELHNYELSEEHWGERPAMYISVFAEHDSMYLKLCFKKKLPYELG